MNRFKIFIPLIGLAFLLVAGCSGSRKYFKAGERLEKNGLVNEASAFYLEALQRKPSNVDARIRLKETGQKYISSLATDFFRKFNTQDFESAITTYETLKKFHETARLLSVNFDYPKTYDEDYKTAIESFMATNFEKAKQLLSQRKYNEALPYIRNVTRYNTDYHNIKQMEDVAVCEPLYQSAVNAIEMKNYQLATTHVQRIVKQNANYKDTKDLEELVNAQLERTVMIFNPESGDKREKHLESTLFGNFNEFLTNKSSIKVINNSPFQSANITLLNSDFELLQAVRKATGADLFYLYDISGINEYNSGEKRTPGRAFYEVKYKKDSVTTVTDYKPADYINVSGERYYSYVFMYKIINAKTNQVVSTKTQTLKSSDAINYNVFSGKVSPGVNISYPYNPSSDGKRNIDVGQWRAQFSGKKSMLSMEDLLNNVYRSNLNIMQNTVTFLK